MNRARRFLAVGLLRTMHSGLALAQAPPGEALATTLFEQARNDMRRGDFAAACPKLAESQRIDPSNGTLLNLVLCEEKVGKIASAWVHSKELVERMPSEDDRRPIVERKLAALAPRLPKLTMRLAPASPPGTNVLLDGVTLGPSSL